MKRQFFLILSLFLASNCFSQTRVSGIVKNEKGDPVFNASVILMRSTDSLTVAFAFTDDEGFYEIFTKSEAEKMLLSVYGFNVKKQTKLIDNVSQTVDFVVKEEAILLQEVSIKSEKIWENNDTISYLVSAFRDTTDVVIADVLKKMPGIEVDDDGKIEYKGKPISKFYIENMDMLQGRYNLATKNISAEDVATVQVLENHQPVKALSNIDIADDAAINIKLKPGSKGTFALTADVGVGYDENLLWDGKLAGMYFGKRQQYLSTLNANNSGYRLTDNRNITVRPFASIIKPSTPTINERSRTFNNSYGFTFNTLQKMKNDAELSVNALYGGDEIKKSSFSQTTYFIPQSDSINLSEDMNSMEMTHNFEAGINYVLNKEKDYLGINFLAAGSNVNDSSNIMRDYLVRQNQSYQAISTKLDLRWVRRNRNDSGKGIEIESKNSYGTLPYSSGARPGSFPDILNDSVKYALTNQDINLTSLKSYNVLRFLSLFVWKRFTLFPTATFSLERQTLGSTLDLTDNGGNTFTLEEPQYGNDILWLKLQPAIGLTFDYRSLRIKSQLYIPVQLRYIDFIDDRNDNSYNNIKVLSQPSFSFKYKMNHRFDISVNSFIYNSTPSLQTLYSGYILRDYRTLARYDSRLADTWGNSSSLKLTYDNIFKYLVCDASVNYNRYKNEVMYAQNFEGDMLIINAVEKESTGDYLSFSLYAGKGFEWHNLNINAKCSYGYGRTPQLVEDKVATYFNKGWNANVTASLRITERIIFSNKGSWSRMISKLEGQTSNQKPIISFIDQANIDFILPFGISVGSSLEYYHTSGMGIRQDFGLLDCNISYTYKRVRFILDCQNILNTKNFVYSYYSDIYGYYSEYSIRPRSVMLTAKFKVL